MGGAIQNHWQHIRATRELSDWGTPMWESWRQGQNKPFMGRSTASGQAAERLKKVGRLRMNKQNKTEGTEDERVHLGYKAVVAEVNGVAVVAVSLEYLQPMVKALLTIFRRLKTALCCKEVLKRLHVRGGMLCSVLCARVCSVLAKLEITRKDIGSARFVGASAWRWLGGERNAACRERLPGRWPECVGDDILGTHVALEECRMKPYETRAEIK